MKRKKKMTDKKEPARVFCTDCEHLQNNTCGHKTSSYYKMNIYRRPVRNCKHRKLVANARQNAIESHLPLESDGEPTPQKEVPEYSGAVVFSELNLEESIITSDRPFDPNAPVIEEGEPYCADCEDKEPEITGTKEANGDNIIDQLVNISTPDEEIEEDPELVSWEEYAKLPNEPVLPSELIEDAIPLTKNEIKKAVKRIDTIEKIEVVKEITITKDTNIGESIKEALEEIIVDISVAEKTATEEIEAGEPVKQAIGEVKQKTPSKDFVEVKYTGIKGMGNETKSDPVIENEVASHSIGAANDMDTALYHSRVWSKDDFDIDFMAIKCDYCGEQGHSRHFHFDEVFKMLQSEQKLKSQFVDDNALLRKRIETIKKFPKEDKDKEALSEQLAKMRDARNNLAIKLSRRQDEINSLKKQILELEKELKDRPALIERIDFLQKERDESKKINDMLEVDVERLNNLCEGLRDELAKCKELFVERQERIKETCLENNRNVAELAAVKDKLKEAEKARDTFSEQFNITRDDLEEKEDSIETLISRIKKDKEYFDKSSKEHDGLLEELEVERNRSAAISSDFNELVKEHNDLQRKYSDLNKNHQVYLDSTNEHEMSSKLRKQLEYEQKKYNKLRGEKIKIDKECDRLKEENRAFGNKLQKMGGNLDVIVEEEITQLRNIVSEEKPKSNRSPLEKKTERESFVCDMMYHSLRSMTMDQLRRKAEELEVPSTHDHKLLLMRLCAKISNCAKCADLI
jgi:hypothetical protein